MSMKNKGWLRRGLVGSLLIVLVLSLSGMAATADTGGDPEPLTGDTPASGTITGSGAGSFAYYSFTYPGGNVDVQVRVEFGVQWRNKGLGFNVYGWDGFSGEGVPQDEGYLELTYGADDPSQMVVQVFNYYDGTVVPYTVTVTGLGTEQAASSETLVAEVETEIETTTETAIDTSASGTIMGSGAGAFGMHYLDYAGDESIVTLTVTFSPVVGWGAFGFQVYGPGGTIVSTGAGTGTPGELQASLQTSVAGQYLVQIFNYLDGALVGYTLTVEQ